jgi:hypothetical protein
LFFSKNSETEISFCFFASSWAMDDKQSCLHENRCIALT